MPKVSIVVPIFKVEQYLEKCIQSVLAQTLHDWELILVNDGSPDRCGEICNQYKKIDSRIQVIHKTNGGLSDARNVGVQRALGNYLLFLDSDDYIEASLLEQTVCMAEQKQADIVMFDFMSIEEETGRRDISNLGIPKDRLLSLSTCPAILFTPPAAWNKLIRKTFWDKMDVTFPLGRNYEDLATLPKLYTKATGIVYLESQPLYFYMLRDNSIMRTKQYAKNYQDRTAALNEVMESYKAQDLFETYQKELEFLVFKTGYFEPSKEIVLGDKSSPYLEMFQEYASEYISKIDENPYFETLSKKDRVLFRLLIKKQYKMMILLSKARKIKDQIKRKKEK